MGPGGPGHHQYAAVAGRRLRSRTALFLTNHASYFEHATITILLAFSLGVHRCFCPSHHKAKNRFVLAICFFGVNGLFLAEAGIAGTSLQPPASRYGQWFQRSEVSPDDLVISQYDVARGCLSCRRLKFLSAGMGKQC